MRKRRVLVAHNNMKFIDDIREFFENRGTFSLTSFALDGQELYKKNSLDNFDIVFVKNALTYVTGLYALEYLLANTKQRPEHIILITPFMNDFIETKCDVLGISYVHDMDLDIKKIPEIITLLDFKKTMGTKSYFDNQLEIIRLFKQIGLLRTYIGYTYLEYVMNIMFEKGENIYKKMRDTYKIIADHFNVSPASVEKAMRICIKSSLSKSDNFYAKLIFGHNKDKDEFPSTSTFIQACVKILKEQKNEIINNSIENSSRKI